jgi:hypothetical protein
VRRELITYVSQRSSSSEDGNPPQEWLGYVMAVGLLVAGVVKTIFFTLSMYLAWLIGMHLKTVLVSAVYNKVSPRSRLKSESRSLSRTLPRRLWCIEYVLMMIVG